MANGRTSRHDALEDLNAEELRALLREVRSDDDGAAEPIAIVGMGCRFPGGVDSPDAFWRLLSSGEHPVGDFPSNRLDGEPDFARRVEGRGGLKGFFLEDIDSFDPGFFGISSYEAPALDPEHRLVLEVAWECLEHAGIAPDGLRGSRTGVFMGATANDAHRQYLASHKADAVHGLTATATMRSSAAGRLAHILGLHGPAMVLDAACSSAAVAIHQACQSLRSQECDLALAGGVKLFCSPTELLAMASLGIMASDGRAKVFGERADGIVHGEGCGVVALKRVQDARAAGDSIWALIRGSAINHDGCCKAYGMPNGEAQIDVIQRGLAAAGLAPSDLQLVEAHGTGVLRGDATELRSLAQVHAQAPGSAPWYVGSVKTQIGHSVGASGVASLIKVVLALRHGQIPKHLHVTHINPRVRVDGHVRIPTQLTPWPQAQGPRRAGVSAFGLSGTNVHCIVEASSERGGDAGSAGDVARSPRAQSAEAVLCLSARSQRALRALARRYLRWLSEHPDASLRRMCETAATGRAHQRNRVAICARDREELEEGLQAFVARDDTGGWLVGTVAGRVASKSEASTTKGPPSCREVAQAYVSGRSVDWRAVFVGPRQTPLALPTYPFERSPYPMKRTGSPDAPSVRSEDGGRRPSRAELAQAWERTLGVQMVRADDSFFELGGDSVAAAHLAHAVSALCASRVQVRDIFEHPRLRDFEQWLSARIGRSSGTAQAPIAVPSSDADGEHEASAGQRRLFWLQRLSPRSVAYNVSGALRLTGPVSTERLTAAMRALHRRHASLRTVFAYRDDRVVQVVEPPDRRTLPWQVYDVAPETGGHRDDVVRRLVGEVVAEPFALSEGWPWRAALLREDETAAVLVLCVHHIACDEQSMACLVKDLAHSYAQGEESTGLGEELSVWTYAGFSAWHEQHLQRNRDTQLDYWREALRGATPTVLPAERCRGASGPRRPAGVARHELSTLLAEELARFAADRGATPFMVLLGAWYVLMGRMTGQRDVVVGVPVSLRASAEMMQTAGFFVNSLALRVQVDPASSFDELLAQCRQVCLQGFDNRDVPFDDVVAALGVSAAQGRNPLFEVMFSFGEDVADEVTFGGLTATTVRIDPLDAMLELAFSVVRAGETYAATAIYDRQVLNRASMQRLLRSYETVVRDALKRPSKPLRGLGMEAAERKACEDPVLMQLRQILTELTGVGAQDDQDNQDNFFSMGGHSLLVLSLLARIHAVFDVELPARTVFDKPTVAELSEAIRQAQQSTAAAASPCSELRSRQWPLDRPVPLSFGQERLWFLEQFEPDAAAYNFSGALRMRGRLDPPALERSINLVVSRHDSLRTCFREVDGKPQAWVLAHRPIRLRRVQEHASKGGEPQRWLDETAAQLSQVPFRLDVDPLLRAVLFELGGYEHILFVTVHHIISDAWSIDVFMAELSLAYEAIVEDRPVLLPPLTLRYADFAAWQRERMASRGPEGLGYWQRLLENAPDLDLPTDRPRRARQTYAGRSCSRQLSAKASSALNLLAQQHGATAHMTLLSAFIVLLARYSGQRDICVGVPVTDRNLSCLEPPLIGFFVNTVAVRCQVPEGCSFADVVRTVRGQTIDAMPHQDIPFEQVVESLSLPRDLSKSPVFRVMFVHQGRREDLRLTGMEVESIDLDIARTQFELTLNVQEEGAESTLRLEYNSDLFDRQTAERMVSNYVALLGSIVGAPDEDVWHLPMAGPEEARFLQRVNDTDTPVPWDGSVVDVFRSWSERTPEATAVECGCRKTSYTELRRCANAVCDALAQQDVVRGDIVAVLHPRDEWFVAAVLGILQVGALYMPLDAAAPAARCAELVKRSGARAVLFGDGVPGVAARGERSLDARWIDLGGVLSAVRGGSTRTSVAVDGHEGGAKRGGSGVADADPAYVVFTSGSTGTPKGAVNTHAGLKNQIWAKVRAFGLGPDTVMAQTAEPTFDICVWQMLAPLCCGGRLVVVPNEVVRDARALVHCCDETGVTVLELVPSVVQTILDLDESLPERLAKLRWLVATGEALPVGVARRWLTSVSGVPLVNAYGPAECSDDVTLQVLVDAPAPDAVSVPIGKPVANMQVHVMDASLQPVPVGAVGELCIGGVGVGLGYLQDEAATRAAFVGGSAVRRAGSERLYRTGDLGRWLADGTLRYVGRGDRQIKVRGIRIEPGEVEAKIQEVPTVREAAVTVRDEGARDAALVAHVSFQGDAMTPRRLREHLAAHLPASHLPSAYVFVPRLPRNAHGKVDYGALPPAREEDLLRDGVHEAPSGPMEGVVASAMMDVLGLRSVGRHDSFFDLGGNSLAAVAWTARLRALLGIQVSVKTLFEAPTVTALARALAHAKGQTRGELAPICPVPREGRYELSVGQQRLWFLEELEPQSAAYNVAGAFVITGSVDVSALQEAFEGVVARHEILRCRVEQARGAPFLVVDSHSKAGALQCGETLDASELAARCIAEAQRPFDLGGEPLVRVHLVRVAQSASAESEQRHLLLVCMHHLVCDAWSVDILSREISALYEGRVTGTAPRLPPLPTQYVDFARWQREELDRGALDEGLRYWKEHLDGVATLQLPLDGQRPRLQTFEGKQAEGWVASEDVEDLRAVCRAFGATPFMGYLAVFYALLHRLGGQKDLCVAVPVSDRGLPELEPLVGYFLNTLALRVRLDREGTFADLLTQVRQVALDGYVHADVPYERVVDAVSPNRDLSLPGLVQVMFVHRGEAQALRLHGVDVQPLPFDGGRSAFDMTLYVDERDGRVRITLEYNTGLFRRSTAESLTKHYATLLRSVTREPDLGLSEHSLVDDADGARLLGPLSAGPRSAAPVPSVLEQLARAVSARPCATAVRDAERSLTYEELWKRSLAWAARLRREGVGEGDVVAVMLPRCADLPAALWAVWQCGAAYVPIDPEAEEPTSHVRRILQHSGASVIVSTEEACRRYASAMAMMSSRLCAPETDGEVLPQAEGVVAKPQSLAYVIYTSGSTGVPKGVRVTHGSLGNLLQGMQRLLQLGERDAWLAVTTITFDIAALELFGPLTAGSTVRLASRVELSEPATVSEILAGEGITHLQGTPSLLRSLVTAGWLPGAEQVVLSGGEALPRDLADRLRATGARLWNLYGPTETTIWSCAAAIGVGRADGDGSEPHLDVMPIGRPLQNTQIYVLDEEQRLAAVGQAGELYIGGDGVADGYVDDPEETRARFVAPPHGLGASGVLFRTGDRVRMLPDGALQFLGRMDEQLKVRGFRVEPAEIETVLREQPGVSDCAVVGVSDATSAVSSLRGYVVCTRDAPSEVELLRALRQRLPAHRVPSRLVLVDCLPLTAAGKTDRRLLATRPLPEALSDDRDGRPQGDVEETVADLFCRLLGVERVTRRDDFFALGGHSLLATMLVARIHEATGQRLAVRAVFESPTVQGLAERLSACLREEGKQEPPLVPTVRAEATPLSHGQQRLWFLQQLEPTSSAYNISGAVRLHGPLDVTILRAAVEDVVARHEALQSRIEVAGSTPCQRRAETSIPIAVHTACGDSEETRAAEARRFCIDLAGRPFDLTVGPLLRLAVVAMGPEDHVMVASMHHIVSDAWSIGIFVRELGACYAARAEQRPVELPPLPVQPADYAVWERIRLSQPQLQQQLAYWRQRLDGVQRLSLTTDRPRPARRTYRGGEVSLVLSARQTGLYDRWVRQQGMTPFGGYLLLLALLLQRQSGCTDLAIGTAVSTRTRVELEPLIGFFTNTLVMRLGLTPMTPLCEALGATRSAVQDALASAEAPFEQVVEASQPDADLSRSPLFDVMFVWEPDAPPDVQLGPLHGHAFAFENPQAKFDLTLFAAREKDGLKLTFVYNSDLFDRDRARGYLEQLRVLHRALPTAEPMTPVGRLPVMSEPTRRQVLARSRGPTRALPRARVHEVFADVALASADRVAVSWEQGTDGEGALRSYTYAEVAARAFRLSHALLQAGVRPGVPVPALLRRSADVAPTMLGVLAAGGGYAPLEPQLPVERLVRTLEALGARLLLTDDEAHPLVDSAGAMGHQVLRVDAVMRDPDLPSEMPSVSVAPEQLAYVVFTSGSTAEPKGAMNSHLGLSNRLADLQTSYDINATDKLAQRTPVGFDVTMWENLWPLCAGAELVVAPEGAHADAGILAGHLARSDASVVHCTPTLLRRLLMQPALRQATSLRCVFCGGEALDASLRDAFFAVSSAKLVNLYGPAETSVDVTQWRCQRGGGPNVPLGTPLGNTHVYVLDEFDEPAPFGAPGQICVGGAAVGLGYAGDSEGTAARFGPDPFVEDPEGRLYRTGDRGYLSAEGVVHFLGRQDTQVQVAGARVELGEIEGALRRHAQVTDAAVVAHPEGKLGVVLVAHVVACRPGSVSSAELRTHLGATLPVYMIPRAFVLTGGLPGLASGKVDRGALLREGIPAADPPRSMVVARTDMERTLARLWCEVTGQGQVSVVETFFNLGGHSLLLAELAQTLRREGMKGVQLVSLFEHPTIESLARHLDGARSECDGADSARAVLRSKAEEQRMRAERLRRRRGRRGEP